MKETIPRQGRLIEIHLVVRENTKIKLKTIKKLIHKAIKTDGAVRIDGPIRAQIIPESEF